MSTNLRLISSRVRMELRGTERPRAVVDSVHGRIATVRFGDALLPAIVPALPVTLTAGMVVELERPRGVGGQLQIVRVLGVSGPAEVDSKVSAALGPVCVILSDTLSVPRAETDGQPYVWGSPPDVNVGGIAVLDGSWSLVIPVTGIYRLTAERADAYPLDGGSSAVAGDFAATVSCLDLFLRIGMSGYPFSPSDGLCYASESGSAVMALDAGTPLDLQYIPGGPANTEVTIASVDTWVRFAVEYLRAG